VLLKRNGNSGLDSADDSGVAHCELRLDLLDHVSSVVLLVGHEDVLDLSFIGHGVHVKNKLVALREDGLVAQ
jgi:hypothetical protein